MTETETATPQQVSEAKLAKIRERIELMLRKAEDPAVSPNEARGVQR